MSLGSWLGGQIDIVGFIKALFAKVYALLFKDEIAKRDKDEAATKAEVQGQLQVIQDDAKQVAAVEVQKQAVEQQIQVEQQKQAADVAKIQEVQRAKVAKDLDIDKQSTLEAFDSIHRSKS